MREEQELSELVEELREYSADYPIIVEGPKDVKALDRAGIKSIPYEGSIIEYSEKIKEKYPNTNRVLILTDYDKAGEELRIMLKNALSRLGIEEDIKLRLKFKRITRLSHIEGFRI